MVSRAMRLLSCLLLLPAHCALSQSVLYVDAAAGGANNGTSWTDAFRSLQAALRSAKQSDELWVAGGTYRPAAARSGFDAAVAVSLYGGFAGNETAQTQRNPAAHPTVLSGDANGDDGPNFSNRGDNSEHVVTATNVSLTLDGFTITGGNASQYGGGLYFGWVRTGAAVVSVRVRDCLFADNQAGSHGGAVCALREWTLLSLELTRCRFLGNRSSAEAGALFYRKDARLVAEDCVFQDNESPDGGAVREYLGDATFRRCSFLGNRSTGGGGAVSLVSGSHTFEECFFATNACGGEGGGLRVCGYPDAAVSAVLRNCVFAGNTAALCGGALAHAFDGQPTTLNAWNGTLYGNAAPAGGGTVWSDSRATVSLANFIIWGNTGGAIVGGAPAVTYSDVQGGYGGTGNLDADPVFLNPADVLGVDRKAGTGDDGLRIPAGSPCADTGTASGAPFIDIIGTTRPYGPGTDMGAYEYDPSVRGPELPGGAVLKIR